MQLPGLATWRRCRPPWMLAAEEADEVRRGEWEANRRGREAPFLFSPTTPAPFLSLLQYGRAASYCAAARGHVEALRTLLA